MGKSVGMILKLLGEFPEITRERFAAEVGLSVRGVEIEGAVMLNCMSAA